MSIEQVLQARSGSKCELCGATDELATYEVPPDADGSEERCALLCATCRAQIEDADQTDPNHWRCLNDSMWSQVPAVQVLAWRMLNRLRDEGWPQALLDMMYLDDATRAWAEAGLETQESESSTQHTDCYGAVLEAGDTVTLVKDLTVKGANFTAKRGTAVRGISLVPDNPGQIEGRVNGQQIVILTKFVKKA